MPTTSWKVRLFWCELDGRHLDDDLKACFSKLADEAPIHLRGVLDVLKFHIGYARFPQESPFFLQFVIFSTILKISGVDLVPIYFDLSDLLCIRRNPILRIIVT